MQIILWMYLKGLELQRHGVALFNRDLPNAVLVGSVVIRVVGWRQEALVFVDLAPADSCKKPEGKLEMFRNLFPDQRNDVKANDDVTTKRYQGAKTRLHSLVFGTFDTGAEEHWFQLSIARDRGWGLTSLTLHVFIQRKFIEGQTEERVIWVPCVSHDYKTRRRAVIWF